MSLPYLISRVFLVQVFLAALIIAVLGSLYALTFTTDHGNEITVPNLRN
jgi:hypothetical protein